MGLFNHLFGSKKSLAKELEMDAKKRMALWKDHIENYFDRKDLASSFDFNRVGKAIADWPSLMSKLDQIEALISKEIITVENEEAVDAEVIADLKHFASGESVDESEELQGTIIAESNKENPMLELFKKLHHMLNVELQVIRLIRQKPANVKDLLTGLFRTICINENEAMAIFEKDNYGSKAKYEKVSGIARAIILEEDLKGEVESDKSKFVKIIESEESKFISKMVKGTEDPESKSQHRKLAEQIYDTLANLVHSHVTSRDPLNNLKALERLIANDSVMISVIRRCRPKYTDEKVRWVMQAFRKAFDLAHFEAWEIRLS